MLISEEIETLKVLSVRHSNHYNHHHSCSNHHQHYNNDDYPGPYNDANNNDNAGSVPRTLHLQCWGAGTVPALVYWT